MAWRATRLPSELDASTGNSFPQQDWGGYTLKGSYSACVYIKSEKDIFPPWCLMMAKRRALGPSTLQGRPFKRMACHPLKEYTTLDTTPVCAKQCRLRSRSHSNKAVTLYKSSVRVTKTPSGPPAERSPSPH